MCTTFEIRLRSTSEARQRFVFRQTPLFAQFITLQIAIIDSDITYKKY